MKFTLRVFLIFICSTFSIAALSAGTQSHSDFVKAKDYQQDFLFQSAFSQGLGAQNIGLDRGQRGDKRLVRFEKWGEKIFLRQINTYYRADTDPMDVRYNERNGVC
jgi:hypothetical protein